MRCQSEYQINIDAVNDRWDVASFSLRVMSLCLANYDTTAAFIIENVRSVMWR